MKFFTSMKTLALVAGMLLAGVGQTLAGDGTKSSPYTVAELNAQKAALAASGNTVWVKADLKGLGEDGTKTENATVDNVKQMAGLFGDATGSFVAYSWQILGELSLSDLTNTKDLLIALTYGTAGHPYGNSSSPQYANNYEPADAHFSLEEVHGALSLQIKNGYRGFHIASSYVVPKEVVAARVSSNYTASKGATIAYGYYDGAENTYIMNKNIALVLLAYDGTYDFVLSSGYYEQINSNSLNPGVKAGVNTIPMKNNALRYHYRFVANGETVGFERNCEESTDVNLASKDEVYLTINGADNHFFGNWTWETADKKWISWTDKKISDFHEKSVSAATPAKGNVVISKIYYGRSKTTAGKMYSWGGFIEIYNNSAEPVNVADLKLGIVEADAPNMAWTRERMAEAHPDQIAIRQVFQIPGTEKILEPGKSLLLVNSAIDHRDISDFECDLSGADFEAKDTQGKFPNNEAVPALDMPYTYVATISYMLLPQTGACSTVLFTTDQDVASLPTVFQYGKEKGNTNIIIPRSWVIDGVEIVAKGADATNKRLYDDIDKGFFVPGDGYTGARIYRKTESVESDGRKVLMDTDNTSVDFQYSTTIQPREYDAVAATAVKDVKTAYADCQTAIFNLQGQKLVRLQKGLNIVNGKKIIVK